MSVDREKNGLLANEWKKMHEQLLSADRCADFNIELARLMFYHGARIATEAALLHPLHVALIACEIRDHERPIREMLESERSGLLQ